MNKGIVIGAIIVAIVIVGVAVLSQEETESDTTIIVTDIENGQTEPKSFEVGLSESVGMKEYP